MQNGELSPYIEEEEFPMNFELKGEFQTHKHLLPVVTMKALGHKRPLFASISRTHVFNDRVECCVLLLDIVWRKSDRRGSLTV